MIVESVALVLRAEGRKVPEDRISTTTTTWKPEWNNHSNNCWLRNIRRLAFVVWETESLLRDKWSLRMRVCVWMREKKKQDRNTQSSWLMIYWIILNSNIIRNNQITNVHVQKIDCNTLILEIIYSWDTASMDAVATRRRSRPLPLSRESCRLHVGFGLHCVTTGFTRAPRAHSFGGIFFFNARVSYYFFLLHIFVVVGLSLALQVQIVKCIHVSFVRCRCWQCKSIMHVDSFRLMANELWSSQSREKNNLFRCICFAALPLSDCANASRIQMCIWSIAHTHWHTCELNSYMQIICADNRQPETEREKCDNLWWSRLYA